MSTPTARTPSFTGRDASADTTRKERSEKPDTPPESARRRALWTCGRRSHVDHIPTGEQNQKKRTFDVLPKPDKLIRYRQYQPEACPLAALGASRACMPKHETVESIREIHAAAAPKPSRPSQPHRR